VVKAEREARVLPAITRSGVVREATVKTVRVCKAEVVLAATEKTVAAEGEEVLEDAAGAVAQEAMVGLSLLLLPTTLTNPSSLSLTVALREPEGMAA
jgi:hypothetical protein